MALTFDIYVWIYCSSLISSPCAAKMSGNGLMMKLFDVSIFGHSGPGNDEIITLEYGTWYHLLRRQQCVLSRNLRSRNVTLQITISKILIFDIICYVAYHSKANFTFPIEQSSDMAAKCGTLDDLCNWKWNRILIAVATKLKLVLTFRFFSSWLCQDWGRLNRLSAKVTQ